MGKLFYPSLSGAMNHEVKKAPDTTRTTLEDRKDEAFEQGEGRGPSFPTEPIKATTRTEWQWGDRFHAAAPNPRDSHHLLGIKETDATAEEKEETD